MFFYAVSIVCAFSDIHLYVCLCGFMVVCAFLNGYLYVF